MAFLYFSMRSIWFDKATYLFVCSYHVMYAFQSESALYNCLNVKELLAQNRREIWSLSDCNRTHNRLVHKRTLSQLTKLVHLLRNCGFESRCSHFSIFISIDFLPLLILLILPIYYLYYLLLKLYFFPLFAL